MGYERGVEPNPWHHHRPLLIASKKEFELDDLVGFLDQKFSYEVDTRGENRYAIIDESKEVIYQVEMLEDEGTGLLKPEIQTVNDEAEKFDSEFSTRHAMNANELELEEFEEYLENPE